MTTGHYREYDFLETKGKNNKQIELDLLKWYLMDLNWFSNCAYRWGNRFKYFHEAHIQKMNETIFGFLKLPLTKTLVYKIAITDKRYVTMEHAAILKDTIETLFAANNIRDDLYFELAAIYGQ